jgi:hypothetical protein
MVIGKEFFMAGKQLDNIQIDTNLQKNSRAFAKWADFYQKQYDDMFICQEKTL